MKRSSKISSVNINLLVRRILAFSLDYTLIVTYALILFGFVHFALNIEPMGPIRGQVVGFFSLTLPVFFYSVFFESGKWRATIGKRLMKLKVVGEGSVVLRNVLKYLPWEIAHCGVHWAFYHDSHGETLSVFIWVLLILPQLVVVIYLASIVISRGKFSVYDKLAGKEIIVDQLS